MGLGGLASERRPRIAWIAGRLEQMGGGERLLFEVREALESLGVEVRVFTWQFDDSALFHGRYARSGIHVLSDGDDPGRAEGVVRGATARLRTLPRMRRELAAFDPSMVVCQSEYDCIMAFAATVGTGRPYALKYFGQMFQFPLDLGKYSLMFRRHLRTIRATMPGYLDTVPLGAPRVGPIERIAAELTAVLRYVAVRMAKQVFTLSRQGQSEVRLLYGRDAVVLRAAFSRRLVRTAGTSARDATPVVLSLCRLVPKKRVDLIVRAFSLVHARRTQVRLVIAGTGETENALRQLVENLRLSPVVSFAGRVSDERRSDLLSECRAFVSVDVADYNITAFEALANGRRVVCASDNEFDAVYRQGGFVFPAEPRPEPLADALEAALVSDPPTMTPQIRSALDEHTWEHYAETMVRVLGLVR